VGRRYWAPRRYGSYDRSITALDYGQAVPVLVTTLEQLKEHGADAAVWRLGRTGEQTLTAALDNSDGDALFRRRAAHAARRRSGGWLPKERHSGRCARGAARSSPTNGGRRPKRQVPAGRPPVTGR
jgi:hypothetical protein